MTPRGVEGRLLMVRTTADNVVRFWVLGDDEGPSDATLEPWNKAFCRPAPRSDRSAPSSASPRAAANREAARRNVAREAGDPVVDSIRRTSAPKRPDRAGRLARVRAALERRGGE